MVEIEILHEDDKSMQLLLKKTDRALANALRRTMIADVPKFAIHRMRMDIGMIVDEADGETYESLGAMSDEMLGHRCAMVPVPTFFEKEEHIPRYFQDECPDCKDLVPEQRGCPQCSVIYAIEQKGTEEGHTVTAEHLVVMGDMKLQIPEEYRTIPLTKLYKGQYLKAVLWAVKGRGRDHAKFSPVSGVTFRPRQKGVMAKPRKAKLLFDLDLTITRKDFTKGVLEDTDKVDLLRSDLNHVGEGTAREVEFDGAIVLEDVEGEFVFSFETDGSMTARICFEQACIELNKRFTDLSKDIVDAL